MLRRFQGLCGYTSPLPSLWLRFEATSPAEAPPDQPVAPTSPPPAEVKPKKPALEWRRLDIAPWRQRGYDQDSPFPLVGAAQSTLWSKQKHVYFLGTTLGPNPVLVVPPFYNDSKAQSLTRFEPMLSALDCRHGCLSVPYPAATVEEAASLVASGSREEGKNTFSRWEQPNWFANDSPNRGVAQQKATFFDDYCHGMADALCAFQVQWAHIFAHGAGAIAALKFALLFPELCGTIILFDTPVTSPSVAKATQNRKMRNLMKQSPVIPTPVLNEINNSQSLNLPHPSGKEDAELYKAMLQPSSDACEVLTEGALTVRHPILMVSNTLVDAGSAKHHGTLLNVRKTVPMKNLKSHYDLFGEGAPATLLSDALQQWMSRFDLDVQLAKRWENLSKTQQPAAAQPAAAAAAEPEAKDQKKQSKKKKKDSK